MYTSLSTHAVPWEPKCVWGVATTTAFGREVEPPLILRYFLKLNPNVLDQLDDNIHVHVSERNKAEFCKALRNTSWDHLYSIEDAHDAFEYFHSVIQNFYLKTIFHLMTLK